MRRPRSSERWLSVDTMWRLIERSLPSDIPPATLQKVKAACFGHLGRIAQDFDRAPPKPRVIGMDPAVLRSLFFAIRELLIHDMTPFLREVILCRLAIEALRAGEPELDLRPGGDGPPA